MDKILYCGGKYYAVWNPTHPRALKDGYIYEHILIVEQKLNRHLTSEEVVHHKDFNGLNNDISNLMVFKTNAAHSLYHQCLRNHYVYSLEISNGVYDVKLLSYDNHKVIDNKYITVCLNCGKMISPKAKYCISCSAREHSQKPDYTTMKNLLATFNYSEIARKYNVTSNAVKKWAKTYELYEYCFHHKPDKNTLINIFNNSRLIDVCKKMNVNSYTIKAWLKSYNLIYVPQKIYCKTLDKTFDSSRDAVRYLNIPGDVKSNAEKLKESINEHTTYQNHEFLIIKPHICELN